MLNRKRGLPWLLICLGMILALCATVMLLQTRNVLQYCVVAPGAGAASDEIPKLAESARKLGDSMKDSLACTAVGGFAETVDVSVEGNACQAGLIAMGEGWNEIYPQFVIEGRRAAENELASGEPVIVLDRELAFRLFGAQLPEDAWVTLNGLEWRVIGTVRHAGSLLGGRGVGDVQPFDCYIPLAAAAKRGVALDTLCLSAVPINSVTKVFEETVRRDWRDGGDLTDLKKEAMRRTVLPRIVLLIAGLYILAALFRAMGAACGRWIADFRQSMRLSYLKPLLPKLAWVILKSVLGFAALTALTCLLLVFSVQPLYTFTEWVPENIVAWSAITKVFWNLTADAGRLVRIGTRELRVIAFWGGVLRWGVVLLLLGQGMMPRKKKKRVKQDR